MAIEVKLDAVVLPHDHKIYKLFPGRDYEFYEFMKRTSVVFVDVRNLKTLGDDPSKWDREKVLNHIATDRVNRMVEQGHERPTRLVRSQGDKATQTFLDGLLFKAKKGDLILMPQKGYADIMVGQLVDEPGTVTTVQLSSGEDATTYAGRRVKWIATIRKLALNDTLIKLLHSRATFFDIGRSHYESVYRLTYDNFVFEEQFFATFRTSKAIFTPKANFLTSVWLELFEVLEEAREEAKSLAEGSIYDLVIDSDIDESARDDLSISVQSPGWFRIRSLVAAPLASLALFGMASQGVAYEQAVVASTSARIVGQADAGCMGSVDESVRAYIVLLGKDRWEQACKLAKQAESEAQLSAGATVVQRKRDED